MISIVTYQRSALFFFAFLTVYIKELSKKGSKKEKRVKGDMSQAVLNV